MPQVITWPQLSMSAWLEILALWFTASLAGGLVLGAGFAIAWKLLGRAAASRSR